MEKKTEVPREGFVEWNWSWSLREGLNLDEKGGGLPREAERMQGLESRMYVCVKRRR